MLAIKGTNTTVKVASADFSIEAGNTKAVTSNGEVRKAPRPPQEKICLTIYLTITFQSLSVCR